jgi:Holliday junction DNA helicase RuvA
MITSINGTLVGLSVDAASIAAAPFIYEVLIPEFTRRQLQSQTGSMITLHTVHYIEGSTQGGRLTPRLVGFITETERDFFDLFCSVDGVGVKKALRAMVRPVKELAELIETQDAKGLANLPGVGPATSERIIAKLRRKMPRFALLVGRDAMPPLAAEHADVVRDAYDALMMLGHAETDAHRLIDAALAGGARFKDTESLLTAIYQKQR